MTILEKLNAIFKDVFMDESIVLTEMTTSDDISDWDSFAHLNVIMSIESSFGLSFSDEESIRLKNVRDIIEIIGLKITSKSINA